MSRRFRHAVPAECDRTRRDFLKGSLATALAAMPPLTASLGRSIAGAPVAPIGAKPPPRVIRLTSEHVLPARIPQLPLLRDALVTGLRNLTNTHTEEEAWHTMLDADDVVLLKFNQSGRTRLQTTPAMATVLIESLVRSGWGPDHLIVVEAGDDHARIGKTRPPDCRWQGQSVHFGRSGADTFTASLDQATAIVNVPFLKTHPRSVMTGCLKNLSHGLIRHPARFHANGCDPAIGEIVASSPIRSRLRLNVVNALRVPFEAGDDAGERRLHTFGGLLLTRDPVAGDAAGFSILNEIRGLQKLPPLLPHARVPAYLLSASKLGLGEYDAANIDLRSHIF